MPAYVIFTSGSTGSPKGCLVPHRGAALCAKAVVRICKFEEDMVFMFKAPFVFDASVREIFSAFAAKGVIAIASPDVHKDPCKIASTIRIEGINCIGFVPTMLNEFVKHLREHPKSAAEVGQTLKLILSGGEQLASAACSQLFKLLPDVAVHNLYGPTEASIDALHFQIFPGSLKSSVAVPIGTCLPHVVVKLAFSRFLQFFLRWLLIFMDFFVDL